MYEGIKERKINVGIIISIPEVDWPQCQQAMAELATIVYVKKVKHPHRLKIKEDFEVKDL